MNNLNLVAIGEICLFAVGLFLTPFVPWRHDKRWAKLLKAMFLVALLATAYLLNNGVILSLGQ